MTPERERLLEAVAEAAGHMANMAAAAPIGVRLGILGAAIAALRAHDATPPVVGETVEVQGHVVWCDVTSRWEVIGFMGGKPPATNSLWRHIATITARVPLPVVPVIPATVEEVKR
jgi:hypothetical protein